MEHRKATGPRRQDRIWTGVLLTLLVITPAPVRASLSLESAIALAQQNDPWIRGSEHRQRAYEAQSVAAGTLPDPMVSAGFANLPTDTFDFDQEAMTQFKVGVSQVLPRGDSRELQQKQLSLIGSQQSLQRDKRRAQVAVQVAHLWLDTWRARESIRLIEDDRNLFEQLVDVAQSRYATAVGGTRQQDLVRAQLELTRLEDRLSVLHETLETSRSQLDQWLIDGDGIPDAGFHRPLSPRLPEITLRHEQLYRPGSEVEAGVLAEYLLRHPAILDLEQKLAASETGIELAQQKYRPEWRINASYGYREDDPLGDERADFFSVGVAVDLPLFTANRQDQQLQSAAATAEAVRTERSLALRQMIAAFHSQRSRLLRLEQREELYRSRLLREMREQAEASLVAYTNDDGDFAEVVRARIAELNARIEALGLEVDRLKTIARLNYFFTPASS